MAWVIEPYKGAGQINLGMTPQQAEKEVGPPDSVRSSATHEREEFRALRLPILTYDETGVIEISFSRQARDVGVLGIHDVFVADPLDVLRIIEREDGNLRESMGIIISIKLGLSLSGFHDNDLNQKTITVFKKGLWDDLDESRHFTIS